VLSFARLAANASIKLPEASFAAVIFGGRVRSGGLGIVVPIFGRIGFAVQSQLFNLVDIWLLRHRGAFLLLVPLPPLPPLNCASSAATRLSICRIASRINAAALASLVALASRLTGLQVQLNDQSTRTQTAVPGHARPLGKAEACTDMRRGGRKRNDRLLPLDTALRCRITLHFLAAPLRAVSRR
jgi:hypothetical protein